jgi:hypothetical protein
MPSFENPVTIMGFRPLGISDIVILLLSIALLYSLLTTYFHRRRLHTSGTRLRGPPSKSFLFGCRQFVTDAPDPGLIYEQWAEEYGSVYRMPDALGTSRVVITDPKAIAHYYAGFSFGYVQSKTAKMAIKHLVSCEIKVRLRI